MGRVPQFPYERRVEQVSPFYRIRPFARTLATFYEPRGFDDIEVNGANG